MSFTTMSSTTIKSSRRWLWYALGGSAFAVLVLCAGLIGSFQVWHSRQQAHQWRAAAAVESLGGTAQSSFSSTSRIAVILERGNAPNNFMLNDLRVTDDDLRPLSTASATRGLFLFNNQITDAGLAHLADLKQLETLDLRRNARVTDAGLVHLEGLTNLKQLYLIRTGVTPAGVARLQQKLPRTKIAH